MYILVSDVILKLSVYLFICLYFVPEISYWKGGGEALDRLFVLFMFHVFRFMARKSDMKMSFEETKQLKCTIVLFCPNS